MTNDKTPNLIPIDLFDTCLVSGYSRKKINSIFSGRENGAYYLNKFENHLKTRGLDIKTYVKKYLNIDWPRCPISNEELGYKMSGKGIEISRFKRGKISKEHCEAFRNACEKLSRDRMGEKNPMFGKDSWNKGLSLKDPRVEKMAAKNRGRKASEETKEKQREVRKNHPLKARHTTKHSEETISILRENTARLWKEGRFNKKTSIERKVEEFLKSLPLVENFEFQYQAKYYTLDFAFPNLKIGIECQGTFFHTDPRVYPDGPISSIQKRNAGRDKAKRKYLTDRGWTVIELWEIEINDGRFKEQLLCELQKLNVIKKSEKSELLI